MTSLFPENKAKTVPSKFKCALSGEVMQDPVFILGSPMLVGYERKNLEDYFDKNGPEDPYNKKEVDTDAVREFVSLRVEIEKFTLINSHLWGTEIPLSKNAKV